MTLATLVFGFFISTLFGVIFHLLRGGNASRFLLYLILGWVGFWGGQVIATLTGWTFGSIGALHLGLATITSLIVLGIGYWLSQVQQSEDE